MKKIIFILPFETMPYTISELEYMMPGIIHYYFDQEQDHLDDLILSYVMPFDKGSFEITKQYYTHMTEFVINFLKSIHIEIHLRDYIKCGFINEAEIINEKLLILTFETIQLD